MTPIIIGTDPELFVFDEGKDRFVSAHDLIPGTKAEPHEVSKGAIQVDGVAAEFNILPASSSHEFLSNVNSVVSSLRAHVQKNSRSLQLRAIPTCWFDPEYFEALPLSAKELGCNPDWNAYTGEKNAPPGTDKPFRTGSFHVHLGWTKHEDPEDSSHFEACRKLVQRLDKTLYIESLSWDSDETRRELYGMIGSFRPKSYGVEYRVLSNAVLKDKRNVLRVYETAFKEAMDFFGFTFKEELSHVA